MIAVRKAFFFFILISCVYLDIWGKDSNPEEAARKNLTLRLEEEKLPYEERDLFPVYGAFSSSIHINIPSKKPGRGLYFVLAVPLPGPEDTARTDAARGERFDMETAIRLARRLKEDDSFSLDIRIAFLGGEYSALPEDVETSRRAGLADLCDIYDESEYVTLLYLDIPAPPGKLILNHGSSGNIAPQGILKPFTQAAERLKIPYGINIRFNELYKLHLAEGPDILRYSQGRGVPAFYVAADAGPDSRPPDGPYGLEELLFSYIKALDVSPDLEYPDYHYSLFHLFGRTFYVSETLTVILILAAAALFLLAFLTYTVVYRRFLIVRWRVFLRRFWVIALQFIILAAALMAADLLTLVFGPLAGVEKDRFGLRTFIVKLFSAGAIYYLILPLFSRIKIPRRAGFYANAAVLLLIVDSLVTASLDITFIPLFLWAIVFASLASLLTKPVLVLVCALLTPVQILGAFVNTITSGEPRLVELLVSGNFLIMIYVALIALPPVLLLKRAALLTERTLPSGRTRTRLLILGATVLLLGTEIFFEARKKENPRIRREIYETDNNGLLRVSLLDSVFLDRRTIALSVTPRKKPRQINLSLAAEQKPLVLYDTPMPYYVSDDAVIFKLGENPDNPFTTELVLPFSFRGQLRIEAVYTEWDRELDPEAPGDAPDGKIDYVLRILREVTIP